MSQDVTIFYSCELYLHFLQQMLSIRKGHLLNQKWKYLFAPKLYLFYFYLFVLQIFIFSSLVLPLLS